MEAANVFPWRTYDDAHAAIGFLERAFGAERHVFHAGEDGSVAHAELRFGNGIVMVGAEIVAELRDLGYSREYSARDLEGNAWQFGTYQALAPKT